MKTGDYGNEPLFAHGCIFSARVRRRLASDQDDAADTAFQRRWDSMEMQQVGFDHDDLLAQPRRQSCFVQLTSRIARLCTLSHKGRGKDRSYMENLTTHTSGKTCS